MQSFFSKPPPILTGVIPDPAPRKDGTMRTGGLKNKSAWYKFPSLPKEGHLRSKGGFPIVVSCLLAKVQLI